jgi:hypothetical protein
VQVKSGGGGQDSNVKSVRQAAGILKTRSSLKKQMGGSEWKETRDGDKRGQKTHPLPICPCVREDAVVIPVKIVQGASVSANNQAGG